MTFPNKIVFFLVFGIFFCSAAGSRGWASTEGRDAVWNPSVTEKLIRLPQSHLKKSLDRDFARSALSDAIAEIEEQIKLKVGTLDDLSKAVSQTEGDLHIELRHQFLAEKRNYINLFKRRQDLRRQHLEKKKSIYERVRKKVLRTRGLDTVEIQALVQQQNEARSRFKREVEQVDLRVFSTLHSPNSQYAQEYGRNLSAANALVQAINSHPMNKRSGTETSEDKATYIRRLMAESDASLAIIEQEDEILGYMAKLVALDAQALTRDLDDTLSLAEPSIEENSTLSSTLNHFIQ